MISEEWSCSGSAGSPGLPGPGRCPGAVPAVPAPGALTPGGLTAVAIGSSGSAGRALPKLSACLGSVTLGCACLECLGSVRDLAGRRHSKSRA